MNQILHIFKKDTRRHWPEILISLALLAMFTRHELHPWQNAASRGFSSPLFFIFDGRIIAPALVLFWAYLTLRVVQGESLVGDRQWWVTKPYEWRNLLAAKLLFILVFIFVPLFHVQVFLLQHFEFPILPNLWGIFWMQGSLFFVLCLPSLLLASLTKNLSQALLVVVSILLLGAGIAWLSTKIPGGEMEYPPAVVEHLQEGLILGALIAVPVWQFARRNRWASCAAFLGVLVLYVLISVAPFDRTPDMIYPLVEAPTAPAQITIQLPESSRRRNAWFDATDNVYLNIPVNVSGVAPRTVVLLSGIKVAADSTQDSRWSRGWKGQYIQVWSEDRQKDLSYEVDRMEYEKIKTRLLHLRIELLLTEYQEADAHNLSISAGRFFDETLGICRLDPLRNPWLQCLKPLHSPGLMASLVPQKNVCAADDEEDTIQDDAHAWEYPNTFDFPDPGLNPVTDYSIMFGPSFVLRDANNTAPQKQQVVHLCPGSEIRLARPVSKRQVRIQLDMPDVRLQDLVETGRP
jgi:hypothetical protein